MRHFTLAVLFTLLIAPALWAQTYCEPDFLGSGNTANGFFTHILEVELNDLDHVVAPPFANPAPHYDTFLTYSTTLTRGDSYPLTIQLGNGANDQTAAVWIDFNQNGVFESLERVFSRQDTANVGNHRVRGNIQVPVGALLGTTRMRVGTKYGFGVPDPCVNSNGVDWSQDFHDYSVEITAPVVQSFEEATCAHPSLEEVTPGSSGNLILQVVVEMNASGTLSPQVADSFRFSSLGTTNPADITAARLYYTGKGSSFTNPQQVGSTVSNPGTFFSISANQQLKAGRNYFWLVYDVSSSAVRSNEIDARCNAVYILGNSRVPDVVSPSGSREIGYCSSVGTQPWFLYVGQVQLNTINITSFYGTGYSNFTFLSTTLMRGQKYGLTLLFGNSVNSGVGRVWMDWNRDGDFDDAGELVNTVNWIASQQSPNTTPVTDSITVPTNAVVGETRMRVSIQYTPPPGPCTNPIQIGEVEDYTINVMENGEPVADFSASRACLGDSTYFTDRSYTVGSDSITSWHWDFGDGDTSILQNPAHLYSAAGVYTVTLTANSSKPGTPSTIEQTVIVDDPVADFSYGLAQAGAPVRFVDETQGGVTIGWQWDFGDAISSGSNTSFSQTPSHTFDSTGTYYVQLIASTGGGCRDTIIKAVTVVSEVPPIAWFSAATANPYEQTPLQLIDLSLNSPTSWSWSFSPSSVTFSQGTSSTSQNPVVSFNALTTYSAQLIVTNAAGSDTVTRTFTTKAYSAPVADFVAVPDTVKAGQFVNFIDETTNDPTSHVWVFGDGDTSYVANPLHQYNATGNYTVKLTASNPSGSSTEIKPNYVVVQNKYRMCDGDVPSSPLYGGVIYDSGDSLGNYSASSNCGFLIASDCAGPLTLTFNSFDFSGGDYLQVFDGRDEDGIPLHSGLGFTGSNLPQPLTATSGYMYIKEVTDEFIGNTGFSAWWSAVPNIRPQAQITADTVGYVNSPTWFYDGTILGTGNSYAWDFNGDGITDTTSDRGYWIFDSLGTNTVRLIVENCKGRDTAWHTLVIDSPTTVPVSDFEALEDTVLPLETVRFIDRSTQGPQQWHWEFLPQGYAFFMNGTDETSQNPEVIFLESGEYTVKLTASNSVGQGNTETKVAYIYVKGSAMMCTWPFMNSFEQGRITDDGGDLANYGPGQNCGYLLDPCASIAYLRFSQFEFEAGDYLRVFDGKDNTGVPLHTGLGFTSGTAPGQLVANSGSFYLEMQTNNGLTAPGFIADWTSIPLPDPVASFTGPDTAYTGGATAYFTSSSTGPGITHYWDFDNDGTIEDSTDNPVWEFTTPGTYTVRLTASNCANADDATRQVVVVNPTQAPVVDFSASMTWASTQDTISLTDLSTQGPNKWEWTITPGNFSWVNGTGDSTQHPHVIFHQPGLYSVQLKAINALGEDTLTKVGYIRIVEYCTPMANVVSPDVGIRRVKIGSIDNSSSNGLQAYSNFTHGKATKLTRRGTYTIDVERSPGSVTVSGKVWIDLNQNGTFSEPDELMVTQPATTSTSWSATFTIPGTALLGTTRMRVAAAEGGKTLGPCSTTGMGEYEDYRVEISLDETPPLITLIGSNPDTTEIGYPYIDPGATATDDLDGNITSRIVSVSNVDTGAVGTYTITYNVTDSAGNPAAEVVRTVIVTGDQTKPVVTLLGDNPYELPVFESFNDPGATAWDNRNGDVTDNISVQSNIDTAKLGTYDVIYTAYDDAGNPASPVVRKVNVVDTTSPAIALVGPQQVTIQDTDPPYQDEGYTLSDNYFDSVLVQVNRSGNYNTSVTTPGTYTIIWTAEDPSGNTSSVTRTIVIEESVGITAEPGFAPAIIYPNPAQDVAWLEVPENSHQWQRMELQDASGRTLLKHERPLKPGSTLRLDLSGFSKGIYLVRLMNEEQVQVLRLTIIE